jgi:hypothetical protein
MLHLKHLLEELYVPGFVSSKDAKPFHVPENFDIYEQGNGWSAYKGENDWENGTTGVCAYIGPEGYHREQARIWFEVQYPKELESMVGEGLSRDRPEYQTIKNWGNKAARRWMREVRRIHREWNPRTSIQDPQHPRFMRKTWKECFIEALKSESMKPFVKNWGVDHSDWRGMSRENVNECFKQGTGWFVHEGSQSISTIFESGKQLSFELSFGNKRGADKDKVRHQAASKWTSLAREIYNNPELNEVGNPKQKTWEECFIEALNDDVMKPFIREMAPIYDPVNFTPRI